MGNRARFIAMIIAKKLHVNNRKKALALLDRWTCCAVRVQIPSCYVLREYCAQADVVKDLVKFKFRRFGDTTPPRTRADGFRDISRCQFSGP